MYRDRELVRNMVASARPEQHRHIRALDFDGRKDQTFTGRSSTKKQEHVAVVVKADSEYFTHFTLETLRAIHQARHLTDIATDNAADVRLPVCAVDTGRDGGMCRLFELYRDSPHSVHSFHCQLHANNLLLRAVFNELDGSTTGSSSFFRIAGPGRRWWGPPS